MRRTRFRPRASTGYRGVTQRGPSRFVARIHVNYQAKHLGVFDTAQEAAFAYNEAVLKFYGQAGAERLNKL